MHCHHTPHQHDRKGSIKALKKTLVIVLTFMVVELVFGWIANSLALITDALHMFTDAGAILLSLFAFWIAQRPANKALTFGYHRAEIIAALISGFSTWGLSAWLIYEAIIRLMNPEPVKGPMVLIVASIGFLANLFMMMLLHKNQKESLNVRGTYIHILGDLLGSLGVVVAGILLILTGWFPIDPLITLLFSVIVIISAYKLVKDTLHILMEGTPKTLLTHDIEKDLLSIESVQSIHDLHIWSITGDQVNLSVHIVADQLQEVLEKAHQLLKEKYLIDHSTVQIEPPNGYLCGPCSFKTKS